jgi:hypothetical protein
MRGGATLAIYTKEKPMTHDSRHQVPATAAAPPARSNRRRRTPTALLMSSLVVISLAFPPAASTANAGLLDSLLGSIEKDVNGLLGNPGGILGTVLGTAEGALNGIVSTVGTIVGSLPVVGGLLGGLL